MLFGTPKGRTIKSKEARMFVLIMYLTLLLVCFTIALVASTMKTTISLPIR